MQNTRRYGVCFVFALYWEQQGGTSMAKGKKSPPRREARAHRELVNLLKAEENGKRPNQNFSESGKKNKSRQPRS